MLNWIAKTFAGKPGQPADDDPTAQWLRKLEKLLAARVAVSKHPWPAGYVARVVAHMASGDDPALLAMPAPLEWIASHYGELDGLYEGFEHVDVAVALRWARLLAAAWHKGGGYLKLALPNGSLWAESLLLHASGESPNSFSFHASRSSSFGITATHLEALLVADGMAPESLLVASFAGDSRQTWMGRSFTLVSRTPDYPAAVDRHLEHLRAAFRDPDANHRLHLVNMLANVPVSTLQRLGDELADFSTSSSKQVRQAVHALAGRAGAAVVGPLRRGAVEGTPEQRQHALRRLDELARELPDKGLAAFARETAAADKARSVREMFKASEAAAEGPGAVPLAYEIAVPAIDWSAAANTVDPALLAQFWHLVDQSIAKTNERAREHHATHGGRYPLRLVEAYGADDKAALARYLASPDIRPAAPCAGNPQRVGQHVREVAVSIAPRLTPVAAFRLVSWFGQVSDGEHLGYFPAAVFDAMHAATQRPTLLELATMLGEAGYRPELPLRNWCMEYGARMARDWADDAVWPFFARHADAIERLLQTPPRHAWSHDQGRVFAAIATLPRPPSNLVDALFRLALGSAKTDRAHAQRALAAQPGKETRIVEALADGKAEVRQFAADWLRRLRHAPALAALEAAVAKEKNDVVKGAMLDALQALGQPVEKYIDRAAIARDAAKSLAKGLPKDIEWFPWTALPPVHWADDGQAVSADTLRWLLAQAVKQKTPEPNAVLRKLCGLMAPRDREALGQFVLEAWIAEDLKLVSPALLNDPQHLPYAPNAGSAIASKGVLAIAAACAGERAAGTAQRYLKQWYGMRAAQGKALIAMLAWIEHPSATQLMLAIGSRFRTRGFQEEATKQAEALAERKGWTLAELADRTIPSAGFDETGMLALSYGERQFSARLLPDFKIELLNPDGKKIAALPEPRQDDDADAAKDSKKALAAARKELKSIVDLQTDRLYEALCTQRDWPAADWRDYLLAHPVVRHLVQRLVWLQTGADGGVVQAFRPLDDGTLTSRDDEEVALPADARVRLAHDSNLPADEALAWREHLADYAVAPLFAQFGKGGYALPADKSRDSALKDFEGHLLEAFALRGRATKLGYTRGAAEDGGWFHTYDKRFPTLGLQAQIRFTGNPLPETNRTVALETLSFQQTGAGMGHAVAVALSQVPAVLLSECHDDLRLIAAEGPGFDPDWQKKCEA